jgi:hypothetical protein
VDLTDYRAEAEQFAQEIGREYYLHFAGHKEDFEIEAIYDRHARLFGREAVNAMRDAGSPELLEMAVEGHIGQATKAESAELARREATLEVQVGDETIPFRQAPISQANETDPERRAAIDAAHREVVERELTPLHIEIHERTVGLSRELGWPSVRAMVEELSGMDLERLAAQTEAFLQASEPAYEPAVGPELERQLGFGFERLRRSDLPAFFRAPSLDRLFPADGLIERLAETIAGLGIPPKADGRVRLDTESRPTKSPRAFCSPVVVPDEVYLVIAPNGGRDDYEALFHEAGHAYHYAHVAPELAFEHRYLGDNGVTECFAFLMQHLTEEPEWLRRRLGLDDASGPLAQAHASKLVFLRRYCAKLGYELELHAEDADLARMPELYSRRLSDAVHVDWPHETWLSDVDPFFYAARYLRAWALETHVRRLLRERFGEAWFDKPEAGALLVSLWREGQRKPAEELLADLTGAELDFSAMLDDLQLSGAAP